MKTVYKYEIPRHKLDGMEFTMPAGASPLPLVVNVQHSSVDERITFWAEVDTAQVDAVRKFAVYGTGHAIPQDSVYVGTTLLMGGRIVFHLYEIGV